MTGRKTIAILGEIGNFCPALAEKLAQQPVRLLFVSVDEGKNAEISDRLGLSNSLAEVAEVEFINCEREGCWEADIIAFTDLRYIEPAFVQRIREVATQKVVLAISEENNEDQSFGKLSELQELLPHSRVFKIVLNSDKMEAEIAGSKEDAEEVQVIFRKAGYKIR